MTEIPCDVAIIGCGPAGLQAAIHAAGKKAKVVVFGKPRKSGLYKAHVANFCCYDKPVKGKQMLAAGRAQAEGFGAIFVEEDIIETKNEDQVFSLLTESGKSFTSHALILSMGVTRKELRVKGEKRMWLS
ncbi:MAG: NAD(P)/FAD-dependent oxidoreductase [Deltaproteobacteria bacterium]|nr:NAD(P)/FAD-dependent oxidoreductase [Deltaproteobacteria bacterium]